MSLLKIIGRTKSGVWFFITPSKYNMQDHVPDVTCHCQVPLNKFSLKNQACCALSLACFLNYLEPRGKNTVNLPKTISLYTTLMKLLGHWSFRPWTTKKVCKRRSSKCTPVVLQEEGTKTTSVYPFRRHFLSAQKRRTCQWRWQDRLRVSQRGVS